MKRKKQLDNDSYRVIAHVDLDCFYVQVERSINKELMKKPVAVVQYNPFGDLKSLRPEDDRLVNNGSLIAVSYEARSKGVKRIMRGAEAKKACSDLLLVQVPTSYGKADLKIYRDASARIVKVLGSRYNNNVIERASIDEFYLDVTVESEKMLCTTDDSALLAHIDRLLALHSRIAGEDNEETQMHKNDIRNGHAGTTTSRAETLHQPEQTTELPQMLSNWFKRPLHLFSTEDRLLVCAAIIVADLRQAVFDELGFTCSAGIAPNKLLAKVSSGMHKPNKETLVPLSIVGHLLSTLPFSRVQGFGGKLGNTLEERFGDRVKTLGDLLTNVREHELTDVFGDETTALMLSIARGIHLDPVQDRALPKSIGCSKSFRSSNMLTKSNLTDGTVLYWLTELSKELHERMEDDAAYHSRRPKQLHVGFSVLAIGAADSNKSLLTTASPVKLGPSRLTLSPETGKPLLAKPSKPATTNTHISNNTKVEDRVAEWNNSRGIDLSKVTTMVSGGPDKLAKTALGLIHRCLAENPRVAGLSEWGISSMGVAATSFAPVVSDKLSIASFFTAADASIKSRDMHQSSCDGTTLSTSTHVLLDESNQTEDAMPATATISATTSAEASNTSNTMQPPTNIDVAIAFQDESFAVKHADETVAPHTLTLMPVDSNATYAASTEPAAARPPRASPDDATDAEPHLARLNSNGDSCISTYSSDDVTALLLRHSMDVDVFAELPSDVQQEVLQVLRSSSSSSSIASAAAPSDNALSEVSAGRKRTVEDVATPELLRHTHPRHDHSSTCSSSNGDILSAANGDSSYHPNETNTNTTSSVQVNSAVQWDSGSIHDRIAQHARRRNDAVKQVFGIQNFFRKH